MKHEYTKVFINLIKINIVFLLNDYILQLMERAQSFKKPSLLQLLRFILTLMFLGVMYVFTFAGR